MKRKELTSIFILITAAISSFAQLTEQKKTYDRGDTLRGSLRPERTCYDVIYYELNIKVDTGQKSITGSNKILFKVIEDFQTMQIDLFENMKIMSITAGGKDLKYRREFNAVFVEMNERMKAGNMGAIIVNYYGKPTIAKRPPWDGGFTWNEDRNGKLWLGVSCEGVGASLWWPCKDYLGDEPDSMRIITTIPNGLKSISNGTEERETPNSDSTTTFVWRVSYPINNYNVTLNIGDYVHFGEKYIANDNSRLALNYYVMPYNLEKAEEQFKQVKPMLACYEKFMGKYPFWNDGYALVETPYLGMEHQGAIAYGNKYLTGYSGRDFSKIGLTFDYIIIHESAHEWWGNSVSCRDLADMWIHESFGTYTEAIYVECMFGADTALLFINTKKGGVGNKNSIVGIYGVNEEGSGDMYNKGMLFLNTLRHITNNDALWWSTIKGMCDTTFKYKNIGYEDVVSYFNKKLGKDLSPVFEQYLKYPKIPVFEYKLKKQKKGEYELSYRWVTDVVNFKMPVYFSASDIHNHVLNATNNFQTLNLKLSNELDFSVNEDWEYFEVKK